MLQLELPFSVTSLLTNSAIVEVHNKKWDGTLSIVEEDCKTNLKQMSKVGAEAANGDKCWGSKNSDTKGGTWQVGANEVSYHALPGSHK